MAKNQLRKNEFEKIKPALLKLGSLDKTQTLILEEKLRTQLSETELQFCEAYLNSNSAKKAAIAIGAKPMLANNRAYQIMIKVEVDYYIRLRKHLQKLEYEFAHHTLTRELSEIAFTDINDVITVTEKGVQLNVEGIKANGKSIKKIVMGGKNGTIIEFHDKSAAIDMLAKHTGYYKADNDQKAEKQVHIYLPENGRGHDTLEIQDPGDKLQEF